MVNEAAFLNGNRTAEDGLDLARVCPGDPEGSVTLRTAVSLSALIASADYYIDLHSGGIVMDVWPMSGYGLSDDPERLDIQRRMARARISRSSGAPAAILTAVRCRSPGTPVSRPSTPSISAEAAAHPREPTPTSRAA
ncbi:MAG: hypothetical protein CM1200mP2_22110 [Planctomycetaceae bacterium]|nr:MAG: hypothetical protein CM1200mP2_22110 [Planctomycetaceae bacterium]